MSLLQNFRDLMYGDYEDDYEETDGNETAEKRENRKELPQRSSGKTVSIQATARLQISICRPKRFEEAADVADMIAHGQPIVLNMESVEMAEARRIMDFISGATYLSGSSISRIAERTYLILHNGMQLDQTEMQTLVGFGSSDICFDSQIAN